MSSSLTTSTRSMDELLALFAFGVTILTVAVSKRKSGRVRHDTERSEYSKAEALELRKKHFMKSVSVSYANSGGLMIMRGKGSWLFDENGRSYLDTRNNVCHVGHCHPKVIQAVSQQIATLNTNTRYLHPNACRLAERLAAKCPDPLQVVIFVNSGSEANDLALRLARAYTKSKNTIVIDGAYHGHTLSVLEVSPYKYKHSREFDLTPQGEGQVTRKTPGKHIWEVPCPDAYRGPHRGENAGRQYANYVKEGCDYFKSKGESTGAIILEGGMSVGGVILPSDDFVRESVTAVRNAGGAYIADEVQTGFGRLGSAFWAFQHGHHGIAPDIVTIGKPAGNGVALGAVVTTREIADAFDNQRVEYFNTFGGNPVACAAGLAVLDIVEEKSLQEHASNVGEYLKECFQNLQDERLNMDLIGEIRGNGLFLGIDLVRSRKDRTPATAETSFICTTLKEKHSILTSIDGFHDNVLVVKPPMVFSKADADHFIKCFEDAVMELERLGENVHNVSRTPT